jgi:hypothetical protein
MCFGSQNRESNILQVRTRTISKQSARASLRPALSRFYLFRSWISQLFNTNNHNCITGAVRWRDDDRVYLSYLEAILDCSWPERDLPQHLGRFRTAERLNTAVTPVKDDFLPRSSSCPAESPRADDVVQD